MRRELLVEEIGEGKDRLYRLRDLKTQSVIADGITFDDLIEELLKIEGQDGRAPKVTHEGELVADASDWLNLYRKGET
jgi:hypothetical protein